MRALLCVVAFLACSPAFAAGKILGVKAAKAPRVSGSYYCPCEQSSYCIGPRGGHFCITKKGKKRYL